MSRRLATTLCLLAMVLTSLWASAEEIPLRRFQHNAWTLQAGAPAQINALAQTTDGYLWLGTVNGLYRFDGVTFETYQLPHGQRFPKASIQSLTATKDGGLWIGYTLSGSSFLKNGVLQTQPVRAKHGGGTIYSIVTAQDGEIWAASYRGPLRLKDGVWSDVSEAVDIGITGCYRLYEDSKATLWMATDEFIYRLPKGADRFEKTEVNAGSNADFVEGPDGTLWMADEHGIFRSSDWKKQASRMPYLFAFPESGPSESISEMLFDQAGALWVLTTKSGVIRITQPSKLLRLPAAARRLFVEHIVLGDGLTADRTLFPLKDREGNIWIATSEGLDRYRVRVFDPAPLPSTFGHYAVGTEPDGAIVVGTESSGLQRFKNGTLSRVSTGKMDRITSVLPAPDGKLWLGGMGDLGYLENSHFVSVPVPPYIQTPARDTQAMTFGPGGDIWIQTDWKYPILGLHEGKWTSVTPLNDEWREAVVMTTDRAERVWAGFMDGVIKVIDHGKIQKLDTKTGLSVGNITALYASGDTMWVGGSRGMNAISGGRAIPVPFAGDIMIEGISGIIRIADGSMWVNSLPGVLRVPGSEVDQFLKNPSHAMQYQLFNYLDGLSGKAPQMRPLPSIIKGVGTILWFTTTNGVVSVDTSNIYRNAVVPPVSIQEVVVDGRALDPASTISLNKGTGNLQVNYTALSLSIPERVFFRYKLEGYDKEWQEAGTRRQAFYAHIPPGHYVFHVIACNNDGVWNDAGATLSVNLPPTFLQSWYFKALLGVLAIAGVWAISMLRMRQATAEIQARLTERFAERERIARDLHDSFFQGVQSLLYRFHTLSRDLPENSSLRSKFEETLTHGDRVMAEGRETVFNLRSRPSQAGMLERELEAFAMTLGLESATEFSLLVTGLPVVFTPEAAEHLIKLGREALNNAYQHAHASKIELAIHYQNEFEMAIRDNGVGIEEHILTQGRLENHWGLPGMRERAELLGATFVIESSQRVGATIRIRVPLARIRSRSRRRGRWATWT